MAINPQISQGTINKLRSALSFVSNPQLNVTSSYLGKAGISLRFEGEAATYLETMTGGVPSPNPFQIAMVTVNILKTQGLSAVYKSQFETSAVVGDFTIQPDVTTLPMYYITNASIENVGDLSFNGESPDFVVTLKGYYIINNNLWNL